jgi:hypothetical protein
MLVQLIGFAAGILLVRQLDQHEYALFTIANTMQGTINVLADIGISIGLISIGGRVWQDRNRFGELISTGLKLRRKLGATGGFNCDTIALPYASKERSFRLLRHDPDHRPSLVGYAFSCRSVCWMSFHVCAPDIRQIQRIDLTGSAVRLAILVGLCLHFS